MTDLTNKTVLITGASRGIGRAIALAFPRTGATLALSHRDEGTADALCAERDALGARYLLVRSDTANGPRPEASTGRLGKSLSHRRAR